MVGASYQELRSLYGDNSLMAESCPPYFSRALSSQPDHRVLFNLTDIQSSKVQQRG